MNPADTRVLFMGSPSFAVPSLRGLLDADYRVIGAVTQPDRPAGRGGRVAAPPVKLAAGQSGIPVLQPESLKDDLSFAQLASLEPDLIVVAAYGKLLPKRLLDLPRRGTVNVHASLLPRWRGASPITAAILAGDTETGVSIMELVLKMDAGPVIATSRTPILPDDTTGSLESRLSSLGARLLIESLPSWCDSETPPVPQDHALATYCALVHKSDGFLRAEIDVHQAERAVRAYNPWPGVSVGYRDSRLQVWRASVTAAPDLDTAPGALAVLAHQPAIALRGGWLVLDEVQRAGGKRLSGRDFLNGERGALPAMVGLV